MNDARTVVGAFMIFFFFVCVYSVFVHLDTFVCPSIGVQGLYANCIPKLSVGG